jgi:hypothetical protein
MENNKIGLGDLLNEILSKLQFEIKDLALMESLNDTKLERTEGLKLIYPKQEIVYSIPKVSAQEILEKVNQREEDFKKFWEMYNKKAGTKDAKTKFLKLSDKEVEQIFKTLPYYLKSTPDLKFRKLPTSYLNQRTWEDEEYLPRKIEVKVNPFRF